MDKREDGYLDCSIAAEIPAFLWSEESGDLVQLFRPKTLPKDDFLYKKLSYVYEYSLSMDIVVDSIPSTDGQNVLMISGLDVSVDPNIWTSILQIWVHSNNQLRIFGNVNSVELYPYYHPDIQLGNLYKVEISHKSENDEKVTIEFLFIKIRFVQIYDIKIDGQQMKRVQNIDAIEFVDVRVSVSKKGLRGIFDGYIDNFQFSAISFHDV